MLKCWLSQALWWRIGYLGDFLAVFKHPTHIVCLVNYMSLMCSLWPQTEQFTSPAQGTEMRKIKSLPRLSFTAATRASHHYMVHSVETFKLQAHSSLWAFHKVWLIDPPPHSLHLPMLPFSEGLLICFFGKVSGWVGYGSLIKACVWDIAYWILVV